MPEEKVKLPLHEIGRLPAAQDNCAIATRKLVAGTGVRGQETSFAVSHTILEGHRFAVRRIPAGDRLLSWGMPFGRTLRDIAPGEYVCNEAVLNELQSRALDFELPSEPNFADDYADYRFDIGQFQPAPRLPAIQGPGRFMGVQRAGKRGVGTRNMIVLIGVSALVAGFVQRLKTEVEPLLHNLDNIDDVVAVFHTEGSNTGENNQELLLRTLAGYMVHSNVAAVLVMDAGDAGVTNRMLHSYATTHNYPLDDVLHSFLSLRGPVDADMKTAAGIIASWLSEANAMGRTPQPLSELKIALQCGGSDAFSGISGNPLAALVSKWIIESGGFALLAETDELIGAESYVLEKVRDAATAMRFLDMIARFQERVEKRGFSAKGNPSGGNRYRGLYNIYLKSLGAATKRHPEVRLDYVIEYGERMSAPGFYFMDSPGNDLESIAGQVASGCNLIFFVTGNGSITNFPFVPTVKIVTTSERCALLSGEMDVNAGAYLDGMPLELLGEKTLDLSLLIASGQSSAGEKAGHSQVQIWRNWQQIGRLDPVDNRGRPMPDGKPLNVPASSQTINIAYSAWQTGAKLASNRIGLIIPSSLCSGQIAAMAAHRLNALGTGKSKQVSLFVPLVHTEGCGSPTLPEFVDPLLGYLAHPSVATALFLEHGCETTHNDFWRLRLREAGMDVEQVGWASVQGDGGIEHVVAKIEDWFADDCARMPAPRSVTVDLSSLRLGLMSEGGVNDETGADLAALVQQIVAAGGTVILPENDLLGTNKAFATILPAERHLHATVAYAHSPSIRGLHIMANPTSQWAESMTGLGATGVDLILAPISRRRQQIHPFIPVLQVAGSAARSRPFHAEIDLLLTGLPQERLDQLLAKISAVLSRTRSPEPGELNDVGFQITRGRIGISL